MKQAFEKYADALLFHPLLYARALLKWLILAAFVGILCGLLGTAFHLGVSWMTQLRQYNVWLILCLPLAGLVVVGCYKLTKSEGLDTNDIIDEVHHGKGLSLCLIPAIFTGTMFTHLCGGSAGREGAALQMGGTIGYHAGKLFHLDDKDLRTATITGMAAFFAALFGTPLAATMFAIMVISVGVFYHVSFIPCFTASLVAYGISVLLGVSPTRFLVQIPPLDTFMLIRVAALAVLCAFVSILFCRSLHTAQKQMKRFLPNPWIRVLIGSLLLITLTILCGSQDYNGIGMDRIAAAIELGEAEPFAFLLKLLFTALTLAAGFKGGEVVPAFFVGASFGCVIGPFLGIPAGFAAALGLVCVFSGATNCPIASVFLSIELFGDGGLLYFALGCGISYMLSGYSGLYSSQKILYSKLKARYINVHANTDTPVETASRSSSCQDKTDSSGSLQ